MPQFCIMEPYLITAKTLAGLENVLAKELELLGASDIKTGKRAVQFTGDDFIMMKANLELRTALSILVPFMEFEAYDENDLYDQVYDFHWEELFELGQTFAIQATVAGTIFNHSKYVALKTKDAIADRFRSKYQRRPSVDTENADYQINLHVNNSICTLSLNASGRSLDKRGYRLQSNEAPLSEVMAAGIILQSGWNKEDDFIDPMSGSGTFSIEAAMIASNQSPGVNRSFGFEKWNDYNHELFMQIKNDALDKVREGTATIYARDIESRNLSIIAANAERANVADAIRVKQEDFFNSKAKSDSGIVMLNPPYGERMNPEDLVPYYKKIGDTLKQNYKGYEAWVISSNIEAIKAFGLKPEKRQRVFNGGLECALNQYKLY